MEHNSQPVPSRQVEVFSDADLSPATVLWNKLLLDPALPHAPQLDVWYDDLIWAKFPNGVGLDVSWFPENRTEPEFVVTLVQNPFQWEPFFERRCPSIE